jgi:hypothetical protein
MGKAKKADVVQLREDELVLATCSNCHNRIWNIIIDQPGKKFYKITGFKCANPDCGQVIAVDIPIKFEEK